MNKKNILDKALSNVIQVIPYEEFVKKIESGKKLRVKLGLDPTAPDLHLGHAVVLSKLKDFQELGHEIIFLIGDFTALIGDPSGRSKTRPVLSSEQIAINMRSYFDQVGRILDINNVTIEYNSKWLGKLTSAEFVQLCAKVTLARIIEREDFATRLQEHQSIGFHELLYPLMQGYDSVALRADIELGGTDQTFNLLMGRTLQQEFGQEPQVIITLPLLEGLDGVQKMSKSLGNAISLNENPAQAYGKLMSISDTLMWRYFKLLLRTIDAEVAQLQQQVTASTRRAIDVKKEMAYKIVAQFWSIPEAQQAQEQFESLFQKQDYSQAKRVAISGSQTQMWIVELLKLLQIVHTSSQAKRLIEAGAIEIDGEKIIDFNASILIKNDMIIKSGKRHIYILSVASE